MRKLKWYIKERHNPQFSEPYYIGLGQITKKDSKKHEHPFYGTNYIHSYDTEESYKLALVVFTKGA